MVVGVGVIVAGGAAASQEEGAGKQEEEGGNGEVESGEDRSWSHGIWPFGELIVYAPVSYPANVLRLGEDLVEQWSLEASTLRDPVGPKVRFNWEVVLICVRGTDLLSRRRGTDRVVRCAVLSHV